MRRPSLRIVGIQSILGIGAEVQEIFEEALVGVAVIMHMHGLSFVIANCYVECGIGVLKPNIVRMGAVRGVLEALEPAVPHLGRLERAR